MSKTASLLQDYLEERRLTGVDNIDHPLFFNSRKQKLTRAGISYIIDKYVEIVRKNNSLILPGKVSPHVFRHTKAMHLLQANVNPIYIRDFLGHASVTTTEIYARADDRMKRQALEIKTWGENVYVKIPVTNTKRESARALIKELSAAGVKLNVTAICTLDQVREVAHALAGGAPSVVSVFAGRIADTGRDPVPLMTEALAICRAADRRIELLWASPRELLNIVQAAETGCDIITVTPDLLKKLELVDKDLGDFSLDTVQMFYRDAQAAGYKL
jgi:transaldolase